MKNHNVISKSGFSVGSFLLFLAVFLSLAGLLGYGYYYFAMRTVSFDLVISPTPTAVYIDGEEIEYNANGPTQIREGKHVLEAVRAGFHPLKEEINVLKGINNTAQHSFLPLDGLLSIAASEEGAKVYLNEDEQPIGVTPIVDYELAAGKYKIRIQPSKEYLPFEDTITTKDKREKTEYFADLSRSWAWVSLVTDPPGARVIDLETSEFIGMTPLRVKRYEGNYYWEAQMGGDYEPHLMRGIQVQSDIDVQLPHHAFEIRKGVLKLTTVPGGASVIVEDHAITGLTPIDEDIEPRRKLKVVVSHPNYKRQEFSIQLAPGEVIDRKLVLVPHQGKAKFETNPQGAEVFVDGVSRGRSPLTLELDAGSHSYKIRLAKFQSENGSVEVLPEQTVLEKRTLKPVGSAGPAIDISTLPRSWTAPNGADMVLVVPKGPFKIGSPASEPTRDANEDQVTVLLTEPFYVAETELTNGEFRQAFSSHDSGKYKGALLNTSDRPVVNVTWHQAAAYCNWLSKKAGVTEVYSEPSSGVFQSSQPVANGFRMLTEAEFEYLCQAPFAQRQPFPWGANVPPPAFTANLADHSARKHFQNTIDDYNDSNLGTAAVRTFSSNTLGVYDLAGNASEWMHNVYEAAYPGAPSPLKNPMGPAKGKIHSVRGSSFADGSFRKIRTSYRSFDNDKSATISFRVMIPAKSVAAIVASN